MKPAASRPDAARQSSTSADHDRLETFRRLAKSVRRNQPDEIRDNFRKVVASYWHGSDVTRLKRIFEHAERPDLLLELLFSETRTFSSGTLIGATLTLASMLDREDDARRWLEARKRGNDTGIVCWGNADYVRKLGVRQPDLVATLRALKYPDLPPLRSAPDLIRYAETVADRVAIEPAFLDWIYRYSTFPLSREAWEKRVKTAFAIDHIVADNDVEPGWHIVLDQSASHHALDSLDANKATLFLMMHGGFIELLVAWLLDAFPDILITANEEGVARARKGEQVYAGEDSRATLFALYKALTQRRAVLMAPDAALGALRSSISVLGVTKQMAEGAAFLAYETGCNTAWCAVAHEGGRFMPRIAVLAGRGQTESYPDFKKRFFEFYAGQFESLLTGSPDNLAVRPGWVNAFKRAAMA